MLSADYFKKNHDNLLFAMIEKARYFIYFILLMSPLSLLKAIPFEAGIALSGGERKRDNFDSALGKYRSSIRISTLNSVASDSDPFLYGYEAFFRFPDILARGHSVGLSFGIKDLPEFSITEIRSDGLYQQLKWKFFSPYVLIGYHYMFSRQPLKFLRRWNLELGGGFGPVINPELNVDGYQADGRSAEKWNASQNGRYGAVYRFESSLSRRYFYNLRFRAGLRYEHMLLGGFAGTTNGTRGTFFYTQNGGIMPLSLTSYNLLYVLESSSYPSDAVPLALIKERILFTSSSTEVFFSISVDTR